MKKKKDSGKIVKEKKSMQQEKTSSTKKSKATTYVKVEDMKTLEQFTRELSVNAKYIKKTIVGNTSAIIRLSRHVKCLYALIVLEAVATIALGVLKLVS